MNRFFTLLLAASCLTAVGQVPDYVPTDGLVIWSPLEGTSGEEVSGASLVQGRFGESNSAYCFDGGDWLELEISEIPVGNSPRSISFWYNQSSVNDNSNGASTAFFYGTISTSMRWASLIWPDTPTLIGEYNDACFGCSGSTTVELISTPLNEWHHVVYTFDGALLSCFINGQLGYTSQKTYNTTETKLTLGKSEDAHKEGEYFSGSLDDIGIWDRALSSEEIASLFNASGPLEGCTNESACNFVLDAVIDDGSCLYVDNCGECGGSSIAGCLDDQACNFNAEAACDDGSCDYSCCPGPGCCDVGTEWSWESNTCIVANPSDSNFDGCVQLNDLLDLLSAYGDCGAEESAWQCGDLLEYQGYDYETVLIGEQCWFAENLRVESYRNGEAIPSIALNGGWEAASFGLNTIFGDGTGNCSEASPAFDACNPELSLSAYGRLYNGFAVIDERGLCPIGWATPGDDEWIELFNFLGGFPVAGEKMKSVEGWFDGVNGTNSSGFNGLPGGKRNWTGSFFGAGESAYFWSHPPQFYVLIDTPNISTGNMDADHGHSVRCIKDAE